jgi:hypothetical protein
MVNTKEKRLLKLSEVQMAEKAQGFHAYLHKLHQLFRYKVCFGVVLCVLWMWTLG